MSIVRLPTRLYLRRPAAARLALQALVLGAALASLPPERLAAQAARIADLTTRPGDTPRRLVGYGLVVGLDGTGDRSFGGFNGQTPTVRSVVNLLQRFGIQVPPEQLIARNVAAVLVTAEASPYLRAGGRFEVQVSSLGDATSLRGGVLWITPLVSDPNEPPVATAQGPVLVSNDESGRVQLRRGNSARIPDGGVLEIDPPAIAPAGAPRLLLRRPDLGQASRIAAAVNAAFGPGTATVDDPGSVTLTPGPGRADSLMGFLAAVDTLPVVQAVPARIIINARDGTVVAGGDVRVGAAAVSHHGLTLKVGGPGSAAGPLAAAPSGGAVPLGDPYAAGVAPGAAAPSGTGAFLSLEPGVTVQEVAAGLHAAGATSQEVAAIFEALREVGAVTAQVSIR
ncbi:MAG TPA: flagellar basal body P-ring protein FlgI [Gemmatimonadales bacterium]|nr:flagellar basal body P-ring protein FlgI [Gemmatimonadales bacterium]